MAVNKIVQVVFNADLRCSHTGLQMTAKALKLNIDTLEPGEVVVFVNAKKTQMKLYGSMNAIVHFKNKNDSKIDLKVLALIPRFFNGSKFRYDDALVEVFKTGGLK